MSQEGPYKYSQYRILPDTTPTMERLKASCQSCGLPADISKPFVDPVTGVTEYACKYIVDEYIKEQVAIIEQRCDIPRLRDSDGQIKIAGVNAYFCGVACLIQGLLTYGRCAGCAKALPRRKLIRDWHLTYKGEGKLMYPKFEYCSPECKQTWSDRKDIWSAYHVLKVFSEFGILVSLPDAPQKVTAGFKGRCASNACGKGRDARGNRVRAQVPRRGDYCSAFCRKLGEEVASRA
jgi:hypothetical protein